MTKNKFKTPPDVAIDDLPFEPNESAFAEWLAGLASSDGFRACHKLYVVLRAFDRAKLDLGLEFSFLKSIVPIADNLAERLEFSYLDNGLPLTEDESANVEILGWIYMHLAERFSRLCQLIDVEGESWTVADKANIIYQAFYTASRVQLYADEVYTLVHDGFWRECYQNFLHAEKSRLVDFEISQGTDNHSTIDSIFKHILIFGILETNCFRSREMKNLYDLLKSFVDMSVITDKLPQNQPFGVYCFNLNTDQNPKRWTPDMPSSDSQSRYIDVVPVAKKLYRSIQQSDTDGNTLQLLNRTLLLKVINMLSRGQHRQTTRFATEGNADGIIGFNNVLSVIAKIHGKSVDKIVPAPAYDPRIAGRWKEPDFDLVPIGDDVERQLYQKRRAELKMDLRMAEMFKAGNPLSTQTENDWTQANIERSRLAEEVTVGHFDIYNSSINSYGLLWKSEAKKIKIGEIFGVEQDRGKRLEIGLVRRITVQSDQALSLGVELIGLESDMVWLVRKGINKNQGKLAIFIPELAVLKQRDSVVVADTQLRSGQDITIVRGRDEISCQLGEILRSTPAINHFELIYDRSI